MAASLMRASVEVHGGVSRRRRVRPARAAYTCGDGGAASDDACYSSVRSLSHSDSVSVWPFSSNYVTLSSNATFIALGNLSFAKVSDINTVVGTKHLSAYAVLGPILPTFSTCGEGRTSRGVILFTTGTPHICLAEIISGFLAYVPQHATRTKKSPIYKACEASVFTAV